MKDFRTPCFRTRQTRRMQKRSAWTCALAVFLTFSYAHEVAAQTTYFESSTSTASAAIPSNIKELKGLPIDYDHYKDYVTTGRPWDPKKIFLFYNVGTGKFLNVGSYWGTHAVLSDVPRPFWLQRRNETYVPNQWVYVRYPESFADEGTFAYDFFTLNKYQIGAKQSDKLSHVKYNYVRLVNTSDNTYESLCAEGMQGTGSAIDMKDSQSIDFNSQRIEAEIDLANVKETYDHGTQGGSDGKVENILSLGSDISEWKSDGSVTDLHFYASKTSAGIYEITVDCLSKDWKEVTHKKVVQISNGSIAKIVISKGSIKVNGIECRPGETSGSYDSPIKPFLALSNLQVGSKQGDTRSYATYNSIQIKEAHEERKDISHVADSDKKFISTVDGNLSFHPLHATIDLSTCKNQGKENILSVGTYISEWGNKVDKKTPSYNIHFYYQSGNLYVDAACNAGTGTDCYTQQTVTLSSTTLQIDLSADGLYINDKKFIPNDANKFNTVLNYLVNDTPSYNVGSQEGKVRSNATISSLTYSDFTPKTTDLVTNKQNNGETFEKDITLDYTKNQYLEAYIDLSTCKKDKENILSIGDQIEKWGQGDATNANNIHIYLRNTKWTENNLYVVYVNKDHSDDYKRAFTVKKDKDGKAIMHVILSKNGLTINGKDMYPAIDPMPAIPYEKDKAGDIVRFKEIGDRILALDDNYKYVIADSDDANAHGIKASSNGYLYTVERRDKKIFPMFISSPFLQESYDKKNQGPFFAWAPYLNNNDGWGNSGLFADRALPQEEVGADTSFKASQWYFEKVDGDDNLYKIYLDMDSVNVPYRTGEVGSEKYDFTKQSGKFYLQATSEQVYSNSLENYGGGIKTDTSTTGLELTDVDVLTKEPSQANLGYWKVINVEEYYNLFKAANKEMSQMFDLSFTLRDPEFSRLSSELSNWKLSNDWSGTYRIGYDNYNKKALSDADYTKDDGTSTIANDQHASNHARYMGVAVDGAAQGRFYQTVTLTYPGWYAINCGGLTTVGARLYAKYGTDDNIVESPLHVLSTDEYYAIQTNQTWPYDKKMPMYNALVMMNDKNAPNGEENVKKLNSQVVFFVDPDVLKANGNKMDVEFGILFDNNGGMTDLAKANQAKVRQAINSLSTQADEGDSTAAGTTSTPETSVQWTVFDNFHLLYGGNDGEPYLILDENDENVDHLDKTIHKYRSGEVDGKTIDKKLYLTRTFSPNNWNTLMLPVGLTKEQYDKAFSDANGTPAPLAELYKLTEDEIQFKTVTREEQYTDKNTNVTYETAYWLKPMTPYIIKPSMANGGMTEKYTAHLYTWKSEGKKYIEKTAGGTGKPYFLIDNINMVEGIVKSTDDISSTFGSHWDFKDMKTQADKNGIEYNYAITGQIANENGTMTAYGHLAKNYTEQNGNSVLINKDDDKRSPMADSYTMSGNKLYYLGGGAKSKGFRCWFQYTRPEAVSASAKPFVCLDGVEMTTGIDQIMSNDDGITLLDRYSNGVYNINGQLVRRNTTSMDGLPKGIYIVNGKKVVKD